ncbi:MAG: DUF3078 domain-containing protein, partial [Muribaculaceae bacterium]|nr:DUF3078 domain-containing protein [Muribaculaceae bacterium]
MKKRVTHLMTIAAVLLTVVCSAVNSAAENNKAKLDTWRTINFDTVTLEPSILYMPLMFESYDSGFPVEEIEGGVNNWLSEALARRASHRSTLNAAMMSHPELVGYNAADMPEVPKEHVVTADPSRNKLVITETPPEVPAVVPVVEAREVKKRNWLHTFKGSLHFTQAYISDNWYQGGENNMNVLGDIQWDFNLNQVLHPNLLFNNTLHYKVGVMTAHNDSLRHYALNED